MGLSDELADERAIRTGILAAPCPTAWCPRHGAPRGRRARRCAVLRCLRRHLGLGGVRRAPPALSGLVDRALGAAGASR
jgi:hypothetical protein